jgi:hypothetical protein
VIELGAVFAPAHSRFWHKEDISQLEFGGMIFAVQSQIAGGTGFLAAGYGRRQGRDDDLVGALSGRGLPCCGCVTTAGQLTTTLCGSVIKQDCREYFWPTTNQHLKRRSAFSGEEA